MVSFFSQVIWVKKNVYSSEEVVNSLCNQKNSKGSAILTFVLVLIRMDSHNKYIIEDL